MNNDATINKNEGDLYVQIEFSPNSILCGKASQGTTHRAASCYVKTWACLSVCKWMWMTEWAGRWR